MTSVWRRIKTGASESDIALIDERTDRSISYVELAGMVENASQLQMAGKSVATVFPIAVESVVLLLAISEGGGTVMPLNPDLTENEYIYFLKQNVDLVIVPDGQETSCVGRAASHLGIPLETYSSTGTVGTRTTNEESLGLKKNMKTVDDHQAALILFTSGTTAEPKTVPLSHHNLLGSVENILVTLPLTSRDVTVCVMPLFHIHGIVACVLTTLCSGGSVVIPAAGKFSATNFFSILSRYGCTWFTAVPTIHQILVLRSSSVVQSQLRFIRSSSSKLAPTVLEQLERVFQVPVIEAYAMTETSYQICSNPCDWVRRKPGSVGFPFGSVQIRIVDQEGAQVGPGSVGEVSVSGPTVTAGYLNNMTANRQNFFATVEEQRWFRTGDAGFIDPSGYLTITGRLKEQINRGGEKISPIEIDLVLKQSEIVLEAVTFGVPDPLYGEAVAVAVVPRSAEAHREELLALLKTSVAKFKLPKQWFFVDSLPKTATGKVQRSEVARMFA